MDEPNQPYPGVDPPRAGLAGRCPRCGKGRLFAGYLRLEPVCSRCGLDLAPLDQADGPAFFVICFGCVPSVLFAVWAETTFQPSIWFHILVSLPIVLLTCIPLLRPLKGWLVASQFHHKAEEGKLVRQGE